ncbi:MAG TPA: enoyl-CoA hydratase-related protein [Amycolatopsis sp.]|nr:enoyl-CoA hydratase-related protein [Amycolatopsis sp.]
MSTLEVTTQGRVARVAFNRPDNHNGVTSAMVIEMYETLSRIARDDGVDVVVLTGNGRMFCPGADLAAGRDEPRDEAEIPDPVNYQSARLLHDMPQVTVAAVNGACAGAGMAWASACDLRIASSAARFSTAFLELGLSSELGLAWTLQRRLGGAAARDLCFLPRKLTADELAHKGFLNAVYPAETFHQDAATFVDTLAGRGSHALRTLKRNLLDADALPFGHYLDLESQRHLAMFRGDAGAETRTRLAAQGDRVGR